jgi:hypothetical protein
VGAAPQVLDDRPASFSSGVGLNSPPRAVSRDVPLVQPHVGRHVAVHVGESRRGEQEVVDVEMPEW